MRTFLFIAVVGLVLAVIMESVNAAPTNVSGDYLKAILERIGEMEKKQQQQTKATAEQLSKILEKISEMEKQTKKKGFLKFQENCWDGFACHKGIEISGDKSLIVRQKGNTSGWHAVFAKYPIVLNSSDFFYYEISVMNKGKRDCGGIVFGFAVKQQTKLDETIQLEKGTYAFYNDGDIWFNGQYKGRNAKYSYGDTVGIGVNSATRQLFFTKNGIRLGNSVLLVDPSFADDSLYPFVSLLGSDNEIEANFGPNFKFDLATLKEGLTIH